jgi:hypothetical protein
MRSNELVGMGSGGPQTLDLAQFRDAISLVCNGVCPPEPALKSLIRVQATCQDSKPPKR